MSQYSLEYTNIVVTHLASFTNTIDDLLLQLPILIKLKVQVPMSLFSIETVPVPLDAETCTGDKREYTQIILETECIALTDNNYVPLTQAQISLCAKIGYTYYCEYAHLCKVLLPVSSLVVHKIYCVTLGNVARVCPWIVQGLMFLSA